MQQRPVFVSPGQDFVSTELAQLRTRAGELRLQASDLEVRKGQLGDQRRRLGADVDPAPIDKQLAQVEHDLASTHIQLEATDKQIHELETARDMARVGFTLAPPPEPSHAAVVRERMAMVGGMILLLPLVLAYARRIWHRGGPRPSVDSEESPRFQRMEQAIEAIALEVERIGEAQRFTTKLLVERQDAAARLTPVSRREPGTITPH